MNYQQRIAWVAKPFQNADVEKGPSSHVSDANPNSRAALVGTSSVPILSQACSNKATNPVAHFYATPLDYTSCRLLSELLESFHASLEHAAVVSRQHLDQMVIKR